MGYFPLYPLPQLEGLITNSPHHGIYAIIGATISWEALMRKTQNIAPAKECSEFDQKNIEELIKSKSNIIHICNEHVVKEDQTPHKEHQNVLNKTRKKIAQQMKTSPKN